MICQCPFCLVNSNDTWFDINLSCPVCQSSPSDSDDSDDYDSDDSDDASTHLMLDIGDGAVNVFLSILYMERPRWNEMLVENDNGDFVTCQIKTKHAFFLRKVIGGWVDPARIASLTPSTRKLIEDNSQRWIHSMNGECCGVYRTERGHYVAESTTTFVDGEVM